VTTLSLNDYSKIRVHLGIAKIVQGAVFLRKTALSSINSPYTNSDFAIARAGLRHAQIHSDAYQFISGIPTSGATHCGLVSGHDFSRAAMARK
jgi:hypothetical protein